MVVMPKEINDIIKSPETAIESNPVGMLELVTFISEADYELDDRTVDMMKKNIGLLDHAPTDKIREEFEKIISARKAGKGIEMLTRIEAMDRILGKDVSRKMTGREMRAFETYALNIDKTKQTRLRRLALFYYCFDNRKAERAIKRLQYPAEEEAVLLDAIHLLDRLYFLSNKYEIKKFLVKHGQEKYDFLDNLSKAQRIVYDMPVNRIESRRYVMENIKEFEEPVFEEDLAITRADLKEQGIGKESDYDRVFNELVDMVHIKPKVNNREELLEYAKKYSKNKLAGPLKKIRYIK